MKAISLNLNFAGAVLPVVDCADGFERVPLKPICDAIGVSWRDQQRKFGQPAGGITPALDAENADVETKPSSYLSRLLGITLEEIHYAGQARQMVCIRVDRVAGYLLTINPDRVRANGNEDAADFLEKKHAEWLDLIHTYEQQRGDMFSQRSIKKAIAIARVAGIRDESLRRLALAELGIESVEAAALGDGRTGNLFARG